MAAAIEDFLSEDGPEAILVFFWLWLWRKGF